MTEVPSAPMGEPVVSILASCDDALLVHDFDIRVEGLAHSLHEEGYLRDVRFFQDSRADPPAGIFQARYSWITCLE